MYKVHQYVITILCKYRLAVGLLLYFAIYKYIGKEQWKTEMLPWPVNPTKGASSCQKQWEGMQLSIFMYRWHSVECY